MTVDTVADSTCFPTKEDSTPCFGPHTTKNGLAKNNSRYNNLKGNQFEEELLADDMSIFKLQVSSPKRRKTTRMNKIPKAQPPKYLKKKLEIEYDTVNGIGRKVHRKLFVNW